MTEFSSRNSAVRAALKRASAMPGRVAGLLGTTVAGLAGAALCVPFLHSVFWLADEGVLLNGADRMLRGGGRLYADFFEFLPPGGFAVTAIWFRIAGISLWSARLLTLSIISGIACFTYLTCRNACKQAFYPVLVVIAWLIMTQGFWTQLNHHWLATLFSMIVAWSALSSLDQSVPRLREPLIGGLAAGWAAMTVETSGALVMLAGAVAFAGSRRPKAQLTAFVAASAVAPSGLFAYVVAEHALRAAVYDIIIFPSLRYASIQWVPFGYFANLQNFLLIFVFPVAAFLALLCVARDRSWCLHNRQLISCIAFALTGLIGLYPRPDASHIGFAVPLACPLLTYCLKNLTAGRLRRFRAIVAAAGIVFCLPACLAYWGISQLALHAPTVPTARGRAAFLGAASGAGAAVARTVQTPANASYFFYPFIPMMSFLAGREQISKYDVFAPDYTLPSQYREACIAVMQNASWIMMDRRWTDPRFLKLVYPAMGNPMPRETRMFEQALESGFALVAQSGAFELRRRTQAANQTVCSGITR